MKKVILAFVLALSLVAIGYAAGSKSQSSFAKETDDKGISINF